MLFTLGSGFAQNFGTLLVCRFFAGTFAAPSLAIGAGSMSDIYPPIDRAAASGLWILLAFLGPVMGPPITGYVAMIKGMSSLEILLTVKSNFFPRLAMDPMGIYTCMHPHICLLPFPIRNVQEDYLTATGGSSRGTTTT